MSVPADDHAARERALDPGESILLQAPAGSGKTEVLTQRYLSLLAQVDEPEEILAITFTRKAAAEMRARILKVLDGDIDPARPTAVRLHALRNAVQRRAVQRDWDALELRTRLRIQTIDSLNHEIARALPLLGGGPPTLSVTDDADALHRAAARMTLHDAEAEGSYQAAADRILRRLDNNWARAEQLLAGMLERRGQWLGTLLRHDSSVLADVVEASVATIVGETLAALEASLSAAQRGDAERLLRLAAKTLAARSPGEDDASWRAWLRPEATLDRSPAQLVAWQALACFLLTQKGDWRRQLTVRDGLPAEAKDAKADALALLESCTRVRGLRERLIALQRLPDVQLGADERAALEALARLLRLAAANLQQVFVRVGRVDHTEVAGIARAALVALGSPTELALRRSAALKHLLVDEFQDTSHEQQQLLEALVVGWAPDDGRSVFAVGDPMQSIYQFRSAEVGLFLRAREQGLGDLPLASLQLTRNFRSLPPLIGWCNRAFIDIFPSLDDVRESAVRFLSAEVGVERATATPGLVQVHPLPTAAAADEAELLAAEVVAARERRPDCSMAVLVQSAGHAPPIIAALRARGFTVRGVDLEPLARQPAVRDVVELGCAMLHPADRVAWLAVLRAPHVGLGLADLLVLTSSADADAPMPTLLVDERRLGELSEEGRRRLARAAPLLLAASSGRGHVDFTTSLRRLWEALGGASALPDLAAARHVSAYLAALRTRLDDGTDLDGATLRDLAETLRIGGDAGDAAAVDVLTIHKAKGLEWDVVLLPGLHRRLRGDERSLLSWIELPRPDRDADLLMAALSVGRGRSDDRLGGYIAYLRRQRQRHERCRLAYVAATRARAELHLFAHAAPNGDGAAQPAANSMLQTFWPAVAGEFAAQPVKRAEEAIVGPAPAAPSLEHRRLPVDWTPTRAAEPMSLPSLRVGGEVEQSLAPLYEWVGVRRRAVGTVVHGELERLAGSSLGEAGSRDGAWRVRLGELGVPANELPGAVAEVRALLASAADDEQLAWILSPDHAEGASEFALSGIIRGQLRDVVIDRTFIAAGTRWVIDYKTSTHEGADLEHFLAEQLERYRPQLETYRLLARALGPQPVRAALYFPLLRRLVELR